MIGIISNPGTGPVSRATREAAAVTMRRFVEDLAIEGVEIIEKPEGDYGEGRFCFTLRRAGKETEIQMPGLPVERVRFMDEPGQSAWDFPRLYVDGDSWLWCFALSSARQDLDTSAAAGGAA